MTFIYVVLNLQILKILRLIENSVRCILFFLIAKKFKKYSCIRIIKITHKYIKKFFLKKNIILQNFNFKKEHIKQEIKNL